MPFRELEGYHVIGPEFMIIDYLRLSTDMLLSSWRLEKTIKRCYLLQKFYPFMSISNVLQCEKFLSSDPLDIKKINAIQNTIFTMTINRPSTVHVGLYAYNHYIKTSEIVESKKSKIKITRIPFLEIICSNYKIDGVDIIVEIKNKYATDKDFIQYVEHYPFFQFLGNSAIIYYKNIPIIKLYSNNKRCVPIHSVPAIDFTTNTKPVGSVNIGTFSTVLMYMQIMIMKARVDQNPDLKKLYHTAISHLIEARDHYFEKYKKSIYDVSLFQEFTTNCVGTPITPEQERKISIELRKKKNQRYTFSYDPAEKKITSLDYSFSNSSGNPINNQKNLKLSRDNNNDDIVEDLEILSGGKTKVLKLKNKK